MVIMRVCVCVCVYVCVCVCEHYAVSHPFQFCHANVYRFEKKIPIISSSLECTWLYHELGRCYLETGDFRKAKQCAVHAVRSANEAGDTAWQLNAYVLLAQAEGQ